MMNNKTMIFQKALAYLLNKFMIVWDYLNHNAFYIAIWLISFLFPRVTEYLLKSRIEKNIKFVRGYLALCPEVAELSLKTISKLREVQTQLNESTYNVRSHCKVMMSPGSRPIKTKRYEVKE